MVQTTCNSHIGKEMKIGGDTVVVDEFVCLGICVTKYRDELKDIKSRIWPAMHTTYYSP